MAVVALLLSEPEFAKAVKRNPGQPQDAIAETFRVFGHLDGTDHLVISGELIREFQGYVGRFKDAEELRRLLRRGSQTLLKGDAKGVIVSLTANQKKKVEERAAQLKVPAPEALGQIITEAIREPLGSY